MALFNLLYNFVFKASTNGGAISQSDDWWDGTNTYLGWHKQY